MVGQCTFVRPNTITMSKALYEYQTEFEIDSVDQLVTFKFKFDQDNETNYYGETGTLSIYSITKENGNQVTLNEIPMDVRTEIARDIISEYGLGDSEYIELEIVK